MKILFAVSEAAPFIKSGGLGDVAGSLPKALVKLGLDVRVIMPKYSSIPKIYLDKMKYICNIKVSLGSQHKYCGAFSIEYENITYYFVDHEAYFYRQGIYGYQDDGERFSFLCRGILELLPVIDFIPDVIHCHDWHTGIIPVLLDAHYRSREQYRSIRSVFTIHNLKFQGIFPPSMMDLLGLNPSYFTVETMEFYGGISFMKGGLVYADSITTVSETYADEIRTPYFGEKLEGVLRKYHYKLKGIVNGIDYDFYNPETDAYIKKPYNYKSLGSKKYNKDNLQEIVGLEKRADIPIISMVTRLTDQKGLDLVERVLDEILAQDLQMVVLGTGDEKYHQMLLYYQNQYRGKLAVRIDFDTSLAQKIYAGSDFLLMPSSFEPCGLSQLIALRYGCIPIVRETGGLKDTIKPFSDINQDGNGFSFAHYNAHDMLYVIERAIETFQQKPKWLKLRRNAMCTDNSWEKSAGKYKEIYQSITGKGVIK